MKQKLFTAQKKRLSFGELLKTSLCALLLLAATAAATIMCWARSIWENLEFEQILSNLNFHPRSLDIWIFSPELKYYLSAGIAVYLLLLAFCNNKKLLAFAALFSLIFVWQIRLIPYLYYSNTSSTLYEKYYRTPQITAADFPAQKRNLLILHLESVEKNFGNADLYGRNLLPKLSAMAVENPSFDDFTSLYGTDYTKAALVAGQCGIPYRSPDPSFGGVATHLQNVICISDILAQNGYETWFAKSADHTFAYTDIFYNLHHYQNIIDRNFLIRGLTAEEIKKNKSSYEGLSDKLLFAKILDLFRTRQIKEPFLMTVFTVDTHVPGTVLPYNCPKIYGDIRDNILCADATVAEFIQNFRQTPYWQNTTVAIVGDHPMFKEIKPEKRQKYQRAIYNVFLNLPHAVSYDKNKPFITMDLAPTYMEAIGIRLKSHAFGLGRSLLSAQPSLISLPEANIKNAIKQFSKVYAKFHRRPVKTYKPYELGTALTGKEVTKYTDYYDEYMGHLFLNTVNMELNAKPDRDLALTVTLNVMLSYKPKLLVNLNGKPLASVKLKKQIGDQTISIKIPAEKITSPKISLEFVNNNYRSIISQSIDIRKFVLE